MLSAKQAYDKTVKLRETISEKQVKELYSLN